MIVKCTFLYKFKLSSNVARKLNSAKYSPKLRIENYNVLTVVYLNKWSVLLNLLFFIIFIKELNIVVSRVFFHL